MRQREWYRFLNMMYQSRELRTLFYVNGEPRAARITNILDGRQGATRSKGLGSVNNPLLSDRDGLLFELDGQEYYVAAAVINDLIEPHRNELYVYLIEDTYAHPKYPPDLRQFVYEQEAQLVVDEPSLSNSEYETALHRVIADVAARFDDDVMQYYKVEEVFETGHQAGQTFLRDLAGTETFLDIAAAAQYANWQAKYVANRGGDPHPLYALKYACLNSLIRRFIGSQSHEQLALSIDRQALSVDCGITLRLMGSSWFAHHRGMHLPSSEITRETRRKINHRYPGLLDEILPGRRQYA